MKTKKRGISLIVLVITIIVMIILASAIILSLSNSGIIEKANEAKSKTDKANMIEAANLTLGEYELEKQLGELTPANQTAEAYVKEKLDGQFTDEMLESLSILDDGTIQILPTIPEGFVVSQIDGENKISEGLVIYALKENENAEDINWTETDTTTVSGQTLLKVQTERDQYVWVPVEGEFERVAWSGEDLDTSYVEPLRADIDHMDDIVNYQDEIDQYNAMKASVEKNGGFYIARYEAGQDGTTAVSKKGASVWNNIAWDSAYNYEGYGDDSQNGAAKTSKKSYDNAERHLIYGIQWDAAMNFMKDVDNPNSTTGKKYIYDSTGMGWYSDNYNGNADHKTGIDLGENAANKVKNVYDMAGNVYEWTYEAYTDYDYGNRVVRGGCYVDGGSSLPASNRLNVNPDLAGGYCGFRFVLYVK